MDHFKQLLFLGIILGLASQSVQEKEPVEVVAIMNKMVELPCAVPRDVASRLEWVDYVYNSNRDPMLIYTSEGETASEGVINDAHPRKDSYTLKRKHTLVISGLTLDDAGLYFCRLRNLDGSYTTLHRYMIYVMGMPTCTAEPEYMDGDSAELLCGVAFNGNTLPTIEWSTKGEIQSGDDQTTMEEFRMSLPLSSLSADNDKQLFVCNVTIGEAYETCQVKLTVKYSVRDIEITPKQEVYHIGDSIKCAARGNPAPTIEWQPAIKGKVGAGWKSFVIPEEWLNMKKTFTCRASNPGDKETNFISRNISFQALGSSSSLSNVTVITDIEGQGQSVTSDSQSLTPTQAKPVTQKPNQKPEARPEEIKEAPVKGGAGTAAASSGGVPLIGIVIGVVAGLFILIVLIAVIIVARRKGNQKTKGHKQVPTSDFSDKDELRDSMNAKGGSPHEGNRTHKGPDRNSNGVVYYNAGPNENNRPSAYITATAEDLDPDTPWRRQNDFV